MIASAEPWLPDSALRCSRSVAPITTCLEEWSNAWLAGSCLSVSRQWERMDRSELPSGDFDNVSEATSFALRIRRDARLILASAMVGRKLTERELRNTRDRLVIDYLVKEALEDMCGRLKSVLPSELGGETATTSARDIFVIVIGCGATDSIIRLEAEMGLLVRIVQEWAGPPRNLGEPQSLQTAFAELELRLSGRIGGSRHSLAELETLGIGDVLMLDAPHTSPIAACLNSQRKGEAALSVLAQEESLMLKIERPANQW